MFEATIKELKANPNFDNEIQAIQAKEILVLTAKFNLNTAILWIRSMAKQAREIKPDFAEKADKMIEDLMLSIGQFSEMEKEMRIARQRTIDLECKVIELTAINANLFVQIQNLQNYIDNEQ